MDLRGLRNAWLSPSGDLIVDHEDFDPASAWHEDLARCIVRDLQGLRTLYEATDYVRRDSPHAYVYEYLESLGWIRLRAWPGELRVRWVLPTPLVPQSQRAIIESWCEANNTTWDEAVDIQFSESMAE